MNPSEPHQHHVTAAKDKIPLSQKICYGTGQISNIILALAMSTLPPFVLTVELKVNPFLVGLAMGIPRLWDAFIDPVVGHLSDVTRTRWGRRKPYLLVGSITVGLCLAVMWQMPRGWSEMTYFWYFTAMSVIFYLAYTLYAAPFVAIGYELTPDYHERTRVMGMMNLIGTLASVGMAWVFKFTQLSIFKDGVQGARVLAVLLGVLVIVLAMVPILFLREPTKHLYVQRAEGEAEAEKRLSLLQAIKSTLTSRSFLCICFATFAFFPGLMLIQNFSSFLVIYYIYGGDKSAASQLIGWSGSLSAALGIAFVPVVTWMGTHFGKRHAFMVCGGLALFGTLIKWFCYQPSMPYVNLIPGPFIGIGFSALWVLMGSMMADVCDEDEMVTGERREGTYSAVYWWIVKLGLSASLVISGILLNVTGFSEKLGGAQVGGTFIKMRLVDVGIPALFIAASIYFIHKFPLTEKRAYEIKAELDKRRAAVA